MSQDNDFNSSWSDMTLPMMPSEEAQLSDSHSSRSSLFSVSTTSTTSSRKANRRRADMVRHKHNSARDLRQRMKSFQQEAATSTTDPELRDDLATVQDSLAAMESVMKGMHALSCNDCGSKTSKMRRSASSGSLRSRMSPSSSRSRRLRRNKTCQHS